MNGFWDLVGRTDGRTRVNSRGGPINNFITLYSMVYCFLGRGGTYAVILLLEHHRLTIIFKMKYKSIFLSIIT